MKKSLVIVLIAGLIGCIVYFFIDMYGYNNKKLALVSELKSSADSISTYDSQDEYVMLENDKVLKINKESVQCFEINSSYTKKPLWQESTYVKYPLVVNNQDTVCVFDKLGYSGTLYNEDGKICDIKTSLPILEISLNANGYTAVLQKEDSKSVITIFNNLGNKIIERISYEENGSIPITVALSDSNDTFAASYLDVSQNTILSKVIFFKIDGKELKDNLFSSFEYKDILVTHLKYISEDEVIAVSDNKIIKINLFSSEDTSVEVNERIKDVVLDFKGTIVLLCSKKSNQLSDDATYIMFYNYNLKKKKEQIIYNTISEILTNKDTLVLGKNKEFYAYNKNGIAKWKNSFSTDAKQVLLFNKSNLVLVVTNRNVELYKVQVANIVPNN